MSDPITIREFQDYPELVGLVRLDFLDEPPQSAHQYWRGLGLPSENLVSIDQLTGTRRIFDHPAPVLSSGMEMALARLHAHLANEVGVLSEMVAIFGDEEGPGETFYRESVSVPPADLIKSQYEVSITHWYLEPKAWHEDPALWDIGLVEQAWSAIVLFTIPGVPWSFASWTYSKFVAREFQRISLDRPCAVLVRETSSWASGANERHESYKPMVFVQPSNPVLARMSKRGKAHHVVFG